MTFLNLKRLVVPAVLAVALTTSSALAPSFAQDTAPATPTTTEGLAAALAPAAPAPPPETVLATVNGQPITQGDIEMAAEDFADDLARVPEGARRGIILDVLIDMHVMADAAAKDGVTETEAFKQRLAFMELQAARNAYVQDKIAGAVTDAEVKARYDEEVGKFGDNMEVRARHILVETEDEAKAIIADLKGGGDFAKIAGEKSKDPGSAAQGGDLGYFSRGQMVPSFEEAAFTLEVGSITETPVKSDFGFHVIQVEDKRKQAPPAYDQVQARLRDLLIREKFASTLASLKGAATIDVLDPTLKADDPAAAPAPAPAQ
ncbi:peptidylprolyl isomerase [Pseudoxanthobacter sp. M-2]|uniref:peptidylprolyl isomerase n=1 Tax=Pseudoxanthobacter sp. M-2 TaxID=3078754 RepID=UPI0038FCC440